MLQLFTAAFAFGPSTTFDAVETDAPVIVSDPEFVDQVVGGNPANISDWPSTVMLVADSMYQVCTGTLVAPDIVITAAHCIDDINVTHIVSGATDVMNGGNWVPVSQSHMHPSYSSWGGSDIAVLELQFDSPDPAIVIASDCVADDFLVDGTPAAIVGYGAISHDGNTGTTRVYEGFSTIADADCSQNFVNGQATTCDPQLRSEDKELFAGGGGVDACFGDSGGPIYIQDQYGTWYVAGVTSRGAQSIYGACGGGGVWVRPDTHLDWIEAEIGRTLDRPTCGPPPAPPQPDPEPEPEPETEPQPGPDTTPDSPSTPDEPSVPVEGGGWRVVGDTLQVAKDTLGSLQLEVEMDSPTDLTFEVVENGALGDAEADLDGLVLYRPLKGVVGADSIRVKITDSLGRSAEMDIEVIVYKAGGCSTSSTMPAWMGLFAGLLLVGARRR